MLYEAFNHIRNLIPVVFLLRAAVQDFKQRELDASSWLPVVILGGFSLGVELAVSPNKEEIVAKLITTLTIFPALYFLNLYEAGDAVMMIGLSLTHISTRKPVMEGCFLQTLSPDFGFTILLNTELIMLTLALLRTFPKFSLKIKEKDCFKPNFLKQKIPFVSLLLPGYVVTILFGSIVPLPFQPSLFGS